MQKQFPSAQMHPPAALLNRTNVADDEDAISGADAVWILGNAFRIFTMQSGFRCSFDLLYSLLKNLKF